VIDGFERLRHDAVIRRHHQHDNVCHLGAACTHTGEGFMARSIDECDLPSVLLHLVGADVLRDAARLASRHVAVRMASSSEVLP
jgi:hypothetical protein